MWTVANSLCLRQRQTIRLWVLVGNTRSLDSYSLTAVQRLLEFSRSSFGDCFQVFLRNISLVKRHRFTCQCATCHSTRIHLTRVDATVSLLTAILRDEDVKELLHRFDDPILRKTAVDSQNVGIERKSSAAKSRQILKHPTKTFFQWQRISNQNFGKIQLDDGVIF